MRLLLDTNALLWALTNAPRIDSVRDLLLADENEVFVSTVSWWEIAIKPRIVKLQASLPELRATAQESGFLELPLLGSHAEILATLPKHHNDPFPHADGSGHRGAYAPDYWGRDAFSIHPFGFAHLRPVISNSEHH